MSELKSCPFCGGKAVPVYTDKQGKTRWRSNIYYPSYRGTIKCSHCEIELPRYYSRISKAAEVWNKRYTEKEGLYNDR